MRVFNLILICILVSNCSPISKRWLSKSLRDSEKKFQHHIGFVLYDIEKDKAIYDYKGDRYFTPASNTKILTFFTSLIVLGDSIPALKYIQTEDSLIFWGTGDPSFLNKQTFNSNKIFSFLKENSGDLYFSTSNFHTAHFGPGWAWDDYNAYYSAERSPLPIYGNTFNLSVSEDSIQATPNYFNQYLVAGEPQEETKIKRALDGNSTVFQRSTQALEEDWDVPFHADQETIIQLLADTLQRPVGIVSRVVPPNAKILYSIPSDNLYKTMMQESDNFVAEQLLLLSAGVLSDSLQPEIAIKKMTASFLDDLIDTPTWVDGSGLSRYNLFTPRSIAQLWGKIYKLRPAEELLPLLATGGKNGTIRNWYKADRPYIFGKTGSLSNNHCLSGYLITKRGRTLIFSFMNSNYIATTSDIRRNMEVVLKKIYTHYR